MRATCSCCVVIIVACIVSQAITHRHARPLFYNAQGYFTYYFNCINSNCLPGGIVLWSRSFTPAAEQLASSSASPVNALIRDALIEGRTADDMYERDGYAVRWTFVNDLELIFVVRASVLLCIQWIDSRGSIGCISTHTSTDICRGLAEVFKDALRQAVPTFPGHLRCVLTLCWLYGCICCKWNLKPCYMGLI
jgi:hypothetical protein